MKKPLISFLAGFSIIFLMALTTDQIIQKVYDSSNTALRVNVVTGGGGAPTGCSLAAGVLTCTGFSANGGNWNAPLGTGPDGFYMYPPGVTASGVNGSVNYYVGTAGASNVTFWQQSSLTDLTHGGYIETAAVPDNQDSGNGTGVSSMQGGPILYLLSDGDLYFGSNGAGGAKVILTTGGLIQTTATGLGLKLLEVSASSGAATYDLLYADSTQHRLAMNNNNGTAINIAGFITGTASITPGTITASQCADAGTTITVTGAVTNDPCMVGPPTAGAGTHISATCYVSAGDTVKVRFCNSNTSNQTGTTGTYRATVVH